MVKTVDILIGADENGNGGLTLMRGTGFKDSPDISDDGVTCFDEVVTQGSDTIGGTIEMDKLAWDSMADYVALRDKLKDMLAKKPEYVLNHAIKGMLPKNNLGRAMMKKLYVYAGPDYKQVAQKPIQLDINDRGEN